MHKKHISKIAAFIAIVIPSIIVFAATPANRSAMITEIGAKLPTNGQGTISAAALRGVLNDFLAGVTIFNGDTNFIASPSALRGYISGLTLSNDTASPLNKIDTSAGTTVSDDATTLIQAGAFTKALTLWTVGSGGGCLDSGAVAPNAWYSVYEIIRPDTGLVDELCSVSATTPTLPTNYTKKRRIGSIKTDGSSNIIAFKQLGNTFLWVTPVLDVSAVLYNTSYTTTNLPSVPSGVVVVPMLSIYASRTGAQALLNVTNPLTGPPNVSGAIFVSWTHIAAVNSQSVFPSVVGGTNLWTDTGQNIRIAADAALTTVSIETLGWNDSRGQYN